MIPISIQEFIDTLSSESVVEYQVHQLGNMDEVAEFILQQVNNFSGITNITIDRQLITKIAIIAKPYLEYADAVNVIYIKAKDTIYFYDRDGICISYVKLEQLLGLLSGEEYPIIAIDGVHAGVTPPSILSEYLNPDIFSDKPIYQAGAYTPIRQADVGILEAIGKMWQMNDHPVTPVMGTAFLWNLIISNGNRPIPSSQETSIEYLQNKQVDNWLSTQTYRGDYIYRENKLPPLEIRNQIQAGHQLSLQVAGAVRSSLYLLDCKRPLILEPHSYSGFSHAFLTKYLSGVSAPSDKNWIELAKKENALRPLVSVLDVQSPDESQGYWTTTVEQADRFYEGFFEVLKQEKNLHQLPIIDGIPDWENDVYGYGGGILTRLKQVMEQASIYSDVEYDLLNRFYQRNILTIEINRLLVQLPEFVDVGNITSKIYSQRCDVVGEALMMGIRSYLR